LIEGSPLKYTPEGYALFTRRLEQHMNRFRNHPMLMQEPYAGLCQLMGDSAVLKVRTIGWLQNLAPTTTSSSIISSCEDFLGVIKRTQDILFCSDMIVSQVSLPGILLTLVSHVQKSTLTAGAQELHSGRAAAVLHDHAPDCRGRADLWQGLSSEFAPMAAIPPGETMEPAPEWAWSNVLNTIPAWEGGIVP
jgi:hypothetical protein